MSLRRLTAAVFILYIACTHSASASAQCDDWRAGPLQNDQSLNGADATVYALTTWDPDGSGPLQPILVAGGNFTRMQDATVQHLAVFDPVTGEWQSLGDPANSPFTSEVRCFAVFNNQLLAGAGNQ